MSHHERSLTIYDSDLLHHIATQVCQAIITIQNQHPQLLIEKYRKIQWQNSSNQSALITKLIELLTPYKNQEELLSKLKYCLKSILVSEAFELQIITELITQINQYNPNLPSHNGSYPYIIQPKLKSGIAVLLLDAENLQLNTNTEKFLATLCQYPIQVKIAFANWHSRGKLDVELHERGYDLIHVPAGRDNADGKMIAFGASIHELYPHAQEVFVCSSDKVMTNLCNNLQQHGLTVYQVSQYGENINILNNYTGQIITHNIKPLPEIPSLNKLVIQLKQLIQQQQKSTGNYWIQLDQITKLYESKYKLNVNNIVDKLLPGKIIRDIFISHSADFVIHQVNHLGELYVTVFKSQVNQNKNINSSSYHAIKTPENIVNINSKVELEQALNLILLGLIKKTKTESFDISVLASKFKQKYGIPITEKMQDLQIGGSFLRFLQSCNDFHIQLKDNKWEVSKLDVLQPPSVTSSNIEDINNSADLEAALKTIILELTESNSDNSIDVSILGVKFHQKYSKPITQQMKDLRISGSLIKFLQSCESFEIRQAENKYKVLVIGN